MEYRKYGRSRLPSRIDRADTMRAAIALPSQIRSSGFTISSAPSDGGCELLE
jgi:hypothetical protein